MGSNGNGNEMDFNRTQFKSERNGLSVNRLISCEFRVLGQGYILLMYDEFLS